MARRLSAGQHQLQVLSVGLCFLVLAVAPMANAAESQLGAWPFRTDEVVILYWVRGWLNPMLPGAGFAQRRRLRHRVLAHPSTR